MSENSGDYHISDFIRMVKSANVLTLENRKALIKKYKELFDMLDDNPLSFYFITDFTTSKYLLFSKSALRIAGLDPTEMMDQGFEVALKKYIHPADKIKLKLIHRKIFEYFYATPVEERTKLKVNFNLRLRQEDNSYTQFMQQSVFTLLGEDGSPIHDFSSCTDISSHKKDNSLELMIYKLDDKGSYRPVLEYKLKEHEKELYNLSDRELEIISLAADGYTALQTADKLFISAHTVIKHRKNILRKTNSRRFAEVVKKISGEN